MFRLKLPWPWKRAPAAEPTLEQLEALYPRSVEAFRAQGRQAETQRIRGVYLAARLKDTDVLTLAAMFDGATEPGAAAVLQVQALKAAAKVEAPPVAPRAARPALTVIH